MSIDLIGNIAIGEVGDKIVEIHQSITSFSSDLTADMVSEIKFTVHDPGLRMHNNNYFMIGRTVKFNGMLFEIAAVTVTHSQQDACQVQARTKAIQEMRRDRRPQSYTTSPSQYAALMADQFGLKIFAEDSPVNGTITKQSGDNQDESTWDVLIRLARDLDFRCFEASGVLFFASEKFIVANQPSFTVTVPSKETAAFFLNEITIQRNEDTEKPSTLSASLYKNTSTLSIFPGVGMKVVGVSHFTDTFMVDRVTFDAMPSSLVRLSATCTVTPEDMACSLEVFQRGSTGDCVKRIQQAVNARPVDGKFGPVTEGAVKRFQTAARLPATGIVDAATWKAIANSNITFATPFTTAITAQPGATSSNNGAALQNTFTPIRRVPSPGTVIFE